MGFALARWGIQVSMAGVLGNDVNGTRIKKEFERVHMDTRYLEPSYDNDTPISIITINKATKMHTIYNISDKYVGLKKCDFDFTPDLIIMDGYDVVANKMILERFPKSISVLDCSIITKSVADLLKRVKYAVMTQEFAEALTGQKIDFQDLKTVSEVYQRIQKNYLNLQFVITIGSRGAVYKVDNQIKISPSLKVDVVDTYGCGEIFRAAFGYVLVEGGDFEKAVKWGCIAGSLTATKYGCRPAIPSLEELNNIYEQNY
jgi:sugar/nucleoside kinase (ribokinase family)